MTGRGRPARRTGRRAPAWRSSSCRARLPDLARPRRDRAAAARPSCRQRELRRRAHPQRQGRRAGSRRGHRAGVPLIVHTSTDSPSTTSRARRRRRHTSRTERRAGPDHRRGTSPIGTGVAVEALRRGWPGPTGSSRSDLVVDGRVGHRVAGDPRARPARCSGCPRTRRSSAPWGGWTSRRPPSTWSRRVPHCDTGTRGRLGRRRTPPRARRPGVATARGLGRPGAASRRARRRRRRCCPPSTSSRWRAATRACPAPSSRPCVRPARGRDGGELGARPRGARRERAAGAARTARRPGRRARRPARPPASPRDRAGRARAGAGPEHRSTPPQLSTVLDEVYSGRLAANP